jgi:hypothetical protein
MNTGIRETTDIITSARITAFDVTAGNPYSSSTISFTFSGTFQEQIYYGTVSGFTAAFSSIWEAHKLRLLC